MTLYRLDLEPDDVAASSLGYRVDTEPAPQSLVTALLEHPQHSAALRLSILGASHAVTLVVDGRDTVTEEVSCRASTSGDGLPSTSALHLGPWGSHHLRGAVETLPPEAFTEVVARLTALGDTGPEVLAGRFPGAEGALTVVSAAADPAGWQWCTWHLYPAIDATGAAAGGEVVTTVSRLELALARALTEAS